ncbi:hypothetical protein EJC49_21360 [Aquibium carbonis]|uniref:Uncharacterized protein n=1 Tax=Aquibium carbonis TaxID=2495581 RepID=A0A429YS72_9HYPH|nr:hypothetical protein [Aquibium carbonis]RST84303.1 hypothetical protein EJC49_21360 [Aquibium carbonis]
MLPVQLAVCAMSVIAVATGPSPAIADPVTIEIGEPGMRHVALTFERSAAGPTVTLRTELTGVAGSRITVRIDRAPTLALDHVFADEECRFPDGNASRCEVVIGPDHPSAQSLLVGFKRGLEAHVTIEDAGIMRMDQSVSLKGFTRRYGA